MFDIATLKYLFEINQHNYHFLKQVKIKYNID